jgi:predicted aspartyl protease
MERIKSISEKRLIIEGLVNGKSAYFLVDTGASLALMDYDQRNEYDLEVGKRYNGTIVGAGGEMRNVRYCNTFVNIENKVIPQFLLADISGVVESIKRETGVEILGIISLPQMSMIGMNIDVNSNEVWLE